MTLFNRPGKAQVRAWLAWRRLASGPPPCAEEIRRALGWCGAGRDAAPAAAAPGLYRAVKN